MFKLLTKKEAAEIINTMLDEYSLSRIVIKWKKVYQWESEERWHAFAFDEYTVKFFKLHFVFRRQKLDSWTDARTLEDLVLNAEKRLKEFDPRVEQANSIRQRHATRLIDKELHT